MFNKGDRMKDSKMKSGGHRKTEERLVKEIGGWCIPTSSCQIRNQKNEMETHMAASTRGSNSLGDGGPPGKLKPPQ